MNYTEKRGIGFTGELIIHIPRMALRQLEKLPLVNSLYIQKMGFFPKAKDHFYRRNNGMSDIVFMFCTDGKGWVQLKHSYTEVKAGDVYIVPPNIPHAYGADDDDPWTIYWFHLAGRHRSQVVNALQGGKANGQNIVRVGLSLTRNKIFEQIADVFKKGYSTSNLLLANLLLQQYLATFISPEFFEPKTVLKREDRASDKAIDFMQKNLAQTLTLQQIAASAHLSVSFFSRQFKKDTGYAPIEYFNHLRIQKACQLLYAPDVRINEVAGKIGITDPFYFSRLFKQQMGIAPAAYRKHWVSNSDTNE